MCLEYLIAKLKAAPSNTFIVKMEENYLLKNNQNTDEYFHSRLSDSPLVAAGR